MSITPPPTPPRGVEGFVDGLLDKDGMEGDSEDFLDFILADPGPQPILDQGKFYSNGVVSVVHILTHLKYVPLQAFSDMFFRHLFLCCELILCPFPLKLST